METRRALLLLTFAIVFSISLGEVLSFRLSDHEWKYFVFSQWWPQSQCYFKGDADSIGDQSFRIVNEYKFRNDCVPANVDSWTIHGLWPNFNRTYYPQYCNRSWPFDIGDIGDLRPKMMSKWIAFPVASERESRELWKHEWEKHGTCASSLPALKNEHAYFSKALALNTQFDLLKMLDGKGLSPSDDKTYEVRDFEDAIMKEYGVKGRVICLEGPDGYQYLAGIRICLDKTFQLIDCKETYPERCSEEDPLKYPVIIRN